MRAPACSTPADRYRFKYGYDRGCYRLACTDGPVFRGSDLLW